MAYNEKSLKNLKPLTDEDRKRGARISAENRKLRKDLAAFVSAYLNEDARKPCANDRKTMLISQIYDIAMNAEKDADRLAAINMLLQLSGDHPDINLRKLDLEIKRMKIEAEEF